MMKKTVTITYRTDVTIKSALATIAAEKKWSISQLTEEIIREWLEEKHPDPYRCKPGLDTERSGAYHR